MKNNVLDDLSKITKQQLSLLILHTFGKGVHRTANERFEQLYKHGFSLERDAKYYQRGELVEAARFCLGVGLWPAEWDVHFRDKIISKPIEERYQIASAFICAEIDRLDPKPL